MLGLVNGNRIHITGKRGSAREERTVGDKVGGWGKQFRWHLLWEIVGGTVIPNKKTAGAAGWEADLFPAQVHSKP